MKFDGDTGQIDVYAVGMLSALQRDWRMITKLRKRPVYTRRCLRYLRERLARREWRAIKNTFNGYLAEPTPFPDDLKRCGSGWTKRRALASLAHQRRCVSSGDT